MSDNKDATFVIHVSKTENETWQGQITWADKDEKQNFRSALEMIKLMESALESEE